MGGVAYRDPRTPDPCPATRSLAGGGEQTASRGDMPAPSLTDVVTTLSTLGKSQLPAQLARWLDELDETGRWALLKLVTGALRIGVSARLAKTAVASLGDKEPDEIELVWPGLKPPYLDLFAWVEGRADKPASQQSRAVPAGDAVARDRGDGFRHARSEGIFRRMEMGRHPRAGGSGHDDATAQRVTRLYSRTGEDISGSFPDLADALQFDGAIDGELLILRDGRVQSFNVLQQRLNRKAVTPKLLAEFPAHLRAYDLLFEGDEDLRELPLDGDAGGSKHW